MALYNFVVIRVYYYYYYYYYYFAIDNIIDAQSNISTFIVIMHELSPHTHTHTKKKKKKKKKKKEKKEWMQKTKSNKTTTKKKKNYSRIKKLFFKDNHNMLLIL